MWMWLDVRPIGNNIVKPSRYIKNGTVRSFHGDYLVCMVFAKQAEQGSYGKGVVMTIYKAEVFYFF